MLWAHDGPLCTLLVFAWCCSLYALTYACDFAHTASVPEVWRRWGGRWDLQGRVQCAVCCLVWCFVALCVLCCAGSFCACCGGRVVHDAGLGSACSYAEAGRRALLACWARARRCGGMEADLVCDSGERFSTTPRKGWCCFRAFWLASCRLEQNESIGLAIITGGWLASSSHQWSRL